MKKKIEDYLYMYPRANVKTPPKSVGVNVCSIGEIHQIMYTHSENQECQVTYPYSSGFFRIQVKLSEVKLILRPLTSMTEEEYEWINNEFGWGISGYLGTNLKNGDKYNMNIFDTFAITKYLLEKSFDIFGLIEAGLAIDSTKQL